MNDAASRVPRIARVRHELRRRRLSVARVERLAPKMVRVVLSGDELEGFASLGFDDHVKMFFPTTKDDLPRVSGASAAIDGAAAAAARDFTPRHFDAEARELWIDFFLHDAGPAASWAVQAVPGQSLEVGGPKTSAVIPLDEIASHVFIGDETALPAIARRLEELPTETRALVVVEIDADSSWPAFASRATVDVLWVARRRSPDEPAQALLEALRKLDLPTDRCFVWVALESQAARAVRAYLREERNIGKGWIKAAAYWKRGAAGVHEPLGEDGPP